MRNVPVQSFGSFLLETDSAERLLRFYHDALGLFAELTAPGICCLSAREGTAPLMYIRQSRMVVATVDDPNNQQSVTIQFTNRWELADAVAGLIRSGVPIADTFQSEHEQTIGFRDPDGLRVELCWQDSTHRSKTDPFPQSRVAGEKFDLNDLLSAAGVESQPISPNVCVSGIQLVVTNLERSTSFYGQNLRMIVEQQGLERNQNLLRFAGSNHFLRLTRAVPPVQTFSTQRPAGLYGFTLTNTINAGARNDNHQNRIVDPDGIEVYSTINNTGPSTRQ